MFVLGYSLVSGKEDMHDTSAPHLICGKQKEGSHATETENFGLCRTFPCARIRILCSRHAGWGNGQSNASSSVQSTASRGERSRESLSYQGELLLLEPY